MDEEDSSGQVEFENFFKVAMLHWHVIDDEARN